MTSHFFLEHLIITFETILSCALVVTWYYVDDQTTQIGSRTTVTSKMELFVIIFDSLRSLKIVTKITILDAEASSIRVIRFLGLSLNQFNAISPLYWNRSMNSNGMKIAGCYEMGIYWFFERLFVCYVIRPYKELLVQS